MGSHVSVRINFKNTMKLRGQSQHDLRGGRVPEYVNQSDSNKNTILFEYDRPAEIEKMALENRSKGEWKRSFKKNSSVGIVGIVTFSHEAQEIISLMDSEAQNQLFKNHIEKLASALGTQVHGAVIHRDETAVHCHFLMNAFTTKGESLSSKIDRQVLSRIQDHAGSVWSDFGITRGEKKMDKINRMRDEGCSEKEITKAVVHRKVRELHRDLPLEISQRENQSREASHKLSQVTQEIDSSKNKLIEIESLLARQAERLEKNERLYRESLIKRENAQGDLLKIEKITKNLGIYENRASDARNQLVALRQELALVTSKLERRFEIISSNEQALIAYGLSFDREGRLHSVHDSHSEISEMNSPRWG